EIAIVVASYEDIATALNRLADDEEVQSRDGGEDLHLREDDIESLRDLASGAPVVRAVNDLLELAVELRASDIHFEALRAGLSVRMRVDGLLRPVPAPVGVLPQAVISRIKIVASLNIAERRLPQDGAARLRIGRLELDIRVAVMPTQYGESAVIRLLPKDKGLLAIEKLGFSPRDDKTLRRLLALTGHLVLTTLHTENAAAAVPRLLDLGVEDFLLRSTLRAVIAQRLVRHLCQRCKSRKLLCAADFDADPRFGSLGFTAGDVVYQ